MKEEGSTYLAHTHSDLGGRFGAALGPEYVVGRGPAPVAGSKRDPVGDEPPLSPDENPGFEPSAVHCPAEQTGEPTSGERVPSSALVHSPLGDDVERVDVGSPPSSHPWRRF